MTKTEEIKKEINQLEAAVQRLVLDFINRNGDCDISINVNQTYFIEGGSGNKIPERVDVKIYVEI